MSANTFGIFDTFDDEAGRGAHLNGEIARALMVNADKLLAKPPRIDNLEILVVKQRNGRAKKAPRKAGLSFAALDVDADFLSPLAVAGSRIQRLPSNPALSILLRAFAVAADAIHGIG